MATQKIVTFSMVLVLILLFKASMSDINVAVGKPASQSSTYHRYGPDKAVDNCTQLYVESGCCSHTDPNNRTTNAHWDVDLGQLMTIDDITIYYRAGYATRFAGYQIYVYNTTGVQPTLCYSDMSSNISDVKLTVTHQCPYVTRYVQVYNYRVNNKRHEWYSDNAVLELCEVQVWGCPVGRYGDGNCDSVCPEDCYGGNCNATTGACFHCAPQKYGDKCDNDCSINCLNQICEKDTGNCNDCVSKTFGKQCDEDCSVNCLDQLCEGETGNCIDCVPRMFGSKCDETCSVNCLNKLCEKDNGSCYDCIPQKYGVKCDNDCSTNCLDRLCMRNNGYCYECISGRYAEICELECSENCNNACAKLTGHCFDCVPQKHGVMCELDCSTNCKGRLCEKETGRCNECITGKRGDGCDMDCPMNCQECTRMTGHCIVCSAGRYGEVCDMACPVTCKDFVCDRDTGQCIECYPGKYGVVCGADCPESCKEGICNKEDGHCLTTESPNTELSSGVSKDIIIIVLAVVCGLLAIVLIVVVMYLRLKGEKRNDSPDQCTGQLGPTTDYTSIDDRQVDPPNVYETIVTQQQSQENSK
ncbi:scavenger receptor class F member 1-like isoform X1 [Argopecten irradians]|uniref:scavenger receptor class F member 1-like isoform X1 n=1 Tax=Argopecten irradians TaxID=31199 RepID=UPI003716D216